MRGLKIAGLVLLAAVPRLIYIAADPSIYAPINPDTIGPTGASQLQSTLVIVAILLLPPPLGLGPGKLSPVRGMPVSMRGNRSSAGLLRRLRIALQDAHVAHGHARMAAVKRASS